MNDQRQLFPVGSTVMTHARCVGVSVDGMEYGALQPGKKGRVIDHTEDGRAVIDFGGDVHTFHDSAWLVRLDVDELSALRAECDALRRQLAIVADQRDKLNADWRAQEVERDNAAAVIYECGQEIVKLRAENTDLRAKLDAAQTERINLLAENTDLRSNLATLREELLDLRRQLGQLTTSLANLRTLARAAQEEVNELKESSRRKRATRKYE